MSVPWTRDDEAVDVYPFPNGSSFDYWEANNCGHCRFYRPAIEPGYAECPLLDALFEARGGTMPLPFARLFGIELDVHSVEDVCPGYQPRKA